MKAVETYSATIFVGLREGYETGGKIHTLNEVWQMCQDFCDVMGTAVTVTETEIVYTGGREGGASIGFISSPRFKPDKKRVMWLAEELSKLLMSRLGQERVFIVSTDKTYMLEA